MRWRDGMEGEGGGAAGTAACIRNHVVKLLLQNVARETSSKLQKNPWKFKDFAGSCFSQLPGSLDFPSNKRSHGPLLAPASAPEAFFATELAAALILV